MGLSPIPIVPGKKQTAVKWDPWQENLSPGKIYQYWSEHPDHEVGCIVGNGLLVLDADTPESVQALAVLEETYDIVPGMVVKTDRGEHHYYRRAPGTYAKTDNHSTEQHPDRIDVKTGRTMVVLPPSTGKQIDILEVNHVDELPEVGQDFIDAVFAHNGRAAPRPAPAVDQVAPPPLDDAGLRAFSAAINQLDPDCGYDDWLHVGMGLHHATGGSEEGLAIWDTWSAPGAKYDGRATLEQKWRSFDDYDGPRITSRTIDAMVLEHLEVLATEAADRETNKPQFQVIEGGKSARSHPQPERAEAHPLARYSITGRSAELRQQAGEQRHLLGQMCLRGQYTVWYAAPNTGKTLLSLDLLGEAATAGRVDPASVYYINADDDYNGLVDKVEFAERFGFQVVSPGFADFEVRYFVQHVQDIVASGRAAETIIVLDTLKKFANVMDKASMTAFNVLIRDLVLHGGTCLVLAHTNKNPGPDGKPIYAGTSDVVDDADCAYTLACIDDDEATQVRTVEFENIKRRGNVVNRAAYRYSRAPGLTYAQLLESVEEVDGAQLDRVNQANVERQDQPVIDAILVALAAGTNKKMELLKGVAVKARVSQRTVSDVLDRYTGDDPARHRWAYTVVVRGAKLYRPLAPAQSDAT